MSELTDRIDRVEEDSRRWQAILDKATRLNFEIIGTGLDSIEYLLQELADRRKADENDKVYIQLPEPAEGQTHWRVFSPNDPSRYEDVPVKPTTYDERDMMAEHGAWFGKERDMQKEFIQADPRDDENFQRYLVHFGKEHPGDTQKEAVGYTYRPSSVAVASQFNDSHKVAFEPKPYTCPYIAQHDRGFQIHCDLPVGHEGRHTCDWGATGNCSVPYPNATYYAADHFYKLCRQIVELGLLSEDATDQMAFIAIRDMLNDHAEQEKQAHAYRPYEEPSSKA